jgi:Domain of unknown function DUF29.
MKTAEDWEWLAASSEYLAAIAIQELLQEQKLMEAGAGLAVLIESMGKSKKLALKSQLTRLMMHVIKWKYQPEKRSGSWSISIRSARQEIADIQEEVPSLNKILLIQFGNNVFNGLSRMLRMKWEKNAH